MSPFRTIGKYKVEPLAIYSGGQGTIYHHQSADGISLLVKVYYRGISNKISDCFGIEQNNNTPYAVKIKESIPEENALVMPFYSPDRYLSLNEMIKSEDPSTTVELLPRQRVLGYDSDRIWP